MKRTVHRLIPAVNDASEHVHNVDIMYSLRFAGISWSWSRREKHQVDVDKRGINVDLEESKTNNMDVGQERY